MMASPSNRSDQRWCSNWSGSETGSGQVDAPLLANRNWQIVRDSCGAGVTHTLECDFSVKNPLVITSLNQP